jgi:formate C-acetyltransferase
MKINRSLSRRHFLTATGAAVGAALGRGWPGGRLSAATVNAPSTGAVSTPRADIAALRRDIVDSPLRVALHRAKTFTKVFQETEDRPWIVRKGLALREYFQTVPLYLRQYDGLAGSISELPGAMPVMVELGIAENGIYTGENSKRQGYLDGRVPDEIRDYWKNRNLWGRFRTEILGQPPVNSADELPRTADYKFISNQGHLSPSYGELLRIGLGGVLRKVQRRQEGETAAEKQAFLAAAEHALTGLSQWMRRYAELLSGEAKRCDHAARAAELRTMAQIAAKVAADPPETFREALQLIWFVHQAVHIEGHGYSNTPDHIDRLLLPFYEADRKAGRLDDSDVLRLVENFVLKMYDNSFWGPEHHLTQGLCLGGSTADGRDQTNRLSWLFLEGATNLALPEPLVWIRWHPQIDQQFFDFCLCRLLRSTCFPLMWNDKAIPEALMELGVTREDAFNYIAVGCNELAIPGQLHYNPGAGVNYLSAIEAVLTDGKGYKGQWRWKNVAAAASELRSFDQFAAAVGAYMRRTLEQSYANDMKVLRAQVQWGQTPLTSCFFDGCLEQARDMVQGVKYNILSCGGIAFANAVDGMAAVREVVFEKRQATLDEVAKACAANFQGYERLRAKLRAAPKHGNDDPRLDEVIRLVERLRDEPLKEICRDPRDGRQFGNSHVVRSSAVRSGLVTPATPDGRLAGTPLASSVAASAGCEHSGPTALLNSVCKLNPKQSWQCGYQVNIRFHAGMIADPSQREKLRAMLNVYFQNGGEELQINVVDTATLRAAQKNPDQYRDLVVRVAGFSEFFVNLTPEMQEDIIARTEHM